jgi:hypothetical protein
MRISHLPCALRAPCKQTVLAGCLIPLQPKPYCYILSCPFGYWQALLITFAIELHGLNGAGYRNYFELATVPQPPGVGSEAGRYELVLKGGPLPWTSPHSCPQPCCLNSFLIWRNSFEVCVRGRGFDL